jgi:hypothetical protein
MFRARWAFWALIITFLGTTAISCQPGSNQIVVRLKEKVDKNITRSTYTLNAEPIHAELTVDRDIRIESKPELRFEVWKGDTKTYSEDVSIPIDQRLSCFRTVMQSFLTTEDKSPSYGLLFYGYSELNQRLPELVARDNNWNRRSGRPRSGGDTYKYLQDVLNRGAAYRELAAAMDYFHYRVGIEGGLENLRILPVSRLSADQQKNLPAGIRETDLLPARVSIDFDLTAEN